jgi:hypothetical protein
VEIKINEVEAEVEAAGEAERAVPRQKGGREKHRERELATGGRARTRRPSGGRHGALRVPMSAAPPTSCRTL